MPNPVATALISGLHVKEYDFSALGGGLPVTFTGSATLGDGASITTWEWSILPSDPDLEGGVPEASALLTGTHGDFTNGKSSVQNPTITLDVPGGYCASLRVQNDIGQWSVPDDDDGGYQAIVYIKTVGGVKQPPSNQKRYQNDLNDGLQTLEDGIGTLLRNGFVDLAESTYNFVPGTRTYSVTPATSSFSYFSGGEKYTKTATENVVIPDTDGLHLVYFNGATLSSTTDLTQLPTILETLALVGVVYWDATNDTYILVGDERLLANVHGSTRALLDQVHGAVYLTGFGISGITADADGSSQDHVKVVAAAGTFSYGGVVQILGATPGYGYQIYYRVGNPGVWDSNGSDGAMSSTGSGRAAFNELSGSTWQVTEAAEGNFVLGHVFATDDWYLVPIAIMGLAEYTSIAAARRGAIAETQQLVADLSGLTPAFFPVATVIYETSSSYTNINRSRLVTNDEGDEYIDWLEASFYRNKNFQIDHGKLNGLGGDDHPDYVSKTRAGDIAGLSLVTAVAGDHLIGEDASDSNNKVRFAASDFLGGSSPLTTKGDLYTFSTVDFRLPVGSDGQFLRADSGETSGLNWETVPVSPMTTKGDLWTRDPLSEPEDVRLPVGTDGHILTADSSEPAGVKWAAAAGGGGFTAYEEEFTAVSGANEFDLSATPSVNANTLSGRNILGVFRNGVRSRYQATATLANEFDQTGGNDKINVVGQSGGEIFTVVFGV